ncbi:MAG: M28 family peptidase, partial [Bacteroidales bacterium]
MNTHRITTLIFFLLISFAVFSQVHSSGTYEYLITIQQQQKHIKELTSSQATGRAVGTIGSTHVKDYIIEAFEKYGLREWRNSYSHKFAVPRGKNSKIGAPPITGCNVVGYIPSQIPASNYIIIGAHYDHMGMMNGRLFPGADDNASGVTVLLELAKAFGEMSKHQKITKNIVFAAFDANNLNLAGSRAFAANLHISPDRINCMINIDQIGSNLAPPAADSSYLLILGADKLKEWDREQITICNNLSTEPLDIDFTYYNSKSF